MRANALWGLVPASLLIVLAGCAGCSSSASTVDARTDVLPRDTSVDRGVDRGADRGTKTDLPLPTKCGGSRTIQPIVIPHGTSQPCGPGCKQISWGYTPDHRYEVAGDLVVYNSAGGPGNRRFTIDLKTGIERQLDPDRPDDKGAGCYMVGTDGKQIATTCIQEWKGSKKFIQSVTLYDATTHVEEDLVCLPRDVDADNCAPSLISVNTTGITVDWTLGTCGQSTALFLPFGETKLKPLAGEGYQGNVAWAVGQGDKVVWSQRKTGWGGDRIVLYDLTTGTQKRIDPREGLVGDQWMPRVQGDKIVWVDHRNDLTGSRFDQRNSDIYLHDLGTGITQPVTTHPALQEWPDVYGDWVVWHDLRANPGGISGKNIDVYAKNMKTGQEVAIANGAESESYPRIDNGRIFFTGWDGVSPHRNLYMVDLATFLAAQGKGP